MHVVRIEPATRAVVIGPGDALDSTVVTIGEQNWLDEPPAIGDEVSVQVRHRGSDVAGCIEELNADRVIIRLFDSHRAVAPGQSAAIYDGDLVLGGGRIV